MAHKKWNIISLSKYLLSHGFICVETKVGSTEDKELILFPILSILGVLCGVIHSFCIAGW